MLEYYIKHLNEYSSSKGIEGSAYFVDKDFVVKKIVDSSPAEVEVIDKYCDEIKSFNILGYKLPNIYAHKTKENQQDSGLFDTYILMERVKGNDLFIIDISDAYSYCKDFCTEIEFKNALLRNDIYLEAQITKSYLKNVLNSNILLQDLHFSEIEEFVDTAYLMYLNGKYSLPDLHSQNVMIDKNHLTHIDPSMNLCLAKIYNEHNALEFLVKDIVYLFYANKTVRKCGARAAKFIKQSPECEKLKELTLSLSQDNLLKMIRHINKKYAPVIRDHFAKEEINSLLFTEFGRVRAGQILNEIEMI